MDSARWIQLVRITHIPHAWNIPRNMRYLKYNNQQELCWLLLDMHKWRVQKSNILMNFNESQLKCRM